MRERERGVCWLVWCGCVLIRAVFSPRRLIDEKRRPCNQSESSDVCGLLTLNENG